MFVETKVTGSLPEMLRDGQHLYAGNLKHYFKVVLGKARNLNAPYHNARHMLHVTWMCYQALLYYVEIGQKIDERDARNLMIAAIFHDFDHTARGGNDDLNIRFAIRGLEANILPVDVPYVDKVKELIGYTQYPHIKDTAKICLSGQILRDADMVQALNPAWLQQVVFGLSTEWGQPPLEVLRSQISFHGNLKLHTDWARTRFPKEMLQEKIDEAKELLAILDH